MSEADAGLRLLLDRGAGALDHPGGTLGAHLRRVGDRLAAHGVAPAVRAAGSCHAAYGTDGFPHPLLGLDERHLLRAAVGPEAEAIVHHYCSCDRARTYPHLGDDPVPFADRFTSTVSPTPRTGLAAFAQLTVANELDVLAHASLGPGTEADLRALFRTLADLLTPAGRSDATRGGSIVATSIERGGVPCRSHRSPAASSTKTPGVPSGPPAGGPST